MRYVGVFGAHLCAVRAWCSWWAGWWAAVHARGDGRLLWRSHGHTAMARAGRRGGRLLAVLLHDGLLANIVFR